MKDERLYPSKTNTRYWGLVKLREAVELVIKDYVAPRKGNGIAQTELLDYGCGDSPYKILFEPHLAKYHRADIEGTPGIDFVIDTATSQVKGLSSKSVDFVLSTQVLEHVVDPENYLAEAHRIAKDDGLLFLSTHGFWLYHPQPNDFWRWTGSGLKHFLATNGWEVIHVEGILGFASASAALLQDAYQPFVRPAFKKIYHRLMGFLIRRFDNKYSPAQRRENAAIYFVIAKKKN